MKISLVTAFPPSQRGLNEYGFHVARELQQIPGLSLTILGDDLPSPQAELDGFSVIRCWSFNKNNNFWRLLRTLRRLQPDVVWFNLGFASFGDDLLPAFLGIILPAFARAAGFDTHVTLHQLMETVDLSDAGVRFPFLYSAGGFVATQILLCANSVSVLLPAYRSILQEKYKRGAVYVRRHGTLSSRSEFPDFARRGNPEHRILAFGKWGTYKRLELLLDAFEIIMRCNPRAQLIVAGTDHPKAPGYMKTVTKRCAEHPRVEFIGYVAEEEIPELFRSTSLAVLPYTSSAGSSGIAHLASAYGVPIVASDIADCRQLVAEEGLAIEFFEPGNHESLAEKVIALLDDPERMKKMALENASAALRMSMPEIIRQYVRTFGLQQRLKGLKVVSRARKVPRWMPLRSWLGRQAARRVTRAVDFPSAAASSSVELADTDSNGDSNGSR
jgi:glycosyltransferase involved in cell wall biosynthesis